MKMTPNVRAPATSSRRRAMMVAALTALTATAALPVVADDEHSGDGSAQQLTIESASWDAGARRLRAFGTAGGRARVTLVNAGDSSQVLGQSRPEGRRGTWSIRADRPQPVPCRVRATQTDGQLAERAVDNAPANCAPGGSGGSNQAPTADANGPYSGTPGVAINFSSAGSADPDGTVASYAWSFGDGGTSAAQNPTHAYGASGSYTVTLTVTDDRGASSALATTTATVSADPVVGCNSDIPQHCGITKYTGPQVCVACHEQEARDMHGSVHYQQGGAFDFVTNIPGNFAAAGERPAKAAGDLVATGINTYCGAHENSPRFTCAGCHVGNGRFPMPQSVFEKLKPESAEAHAQLANIDCLTCHQELYKRFPDWTANGLGFTDFALLNLTEDVSSGKLVQFDGAELLRTGLSGIPNVDPVTKDFQFLPAGSDTLPASAPLEPMSITTLDAARNVHATTRMSCLNCHAGAGGGDGTKRGDLAKENANPSVAVDMHMSPQGGDLTCADCHSAIGSAGEGHRIRGRGLDLRPNDVQDRFTCETGGCHDDRPHGDFSNTQGSSRDKHAMKVACQTCHIPAYAKAGVGTEVARDWQDPQPAEAACNGRGGWLPREDKGGLGTASLIPAYTWFDGTSEIAYLDESLQGVPTVPLDPRVAASFGAGFSANEPAYVLGAPNGNVGSATAKIFPMKPHWSKLARNDARNTFVAHSTFEFFRTGSFCRAVAVGLGLDEANAPTSNVCIGAPGDTEMPPGTSVVPVFTYQTINHGVERRANALGGEARGCGSCHSSLSGGPQQLDLAGLGYGLRTQPSAVVGTRTATLNGNLDAICSQCHENERESRDFSGVHRRHVQGEGKDCAACHNFSRPERGLSLTRGESD